MGQHHYSVTKAHEQIGCSGAWTAHRRRSDNPIRWWLHRAVSVILAPVLPAVHRVQSTAHRISVTALAVSMFWVAVLVGLALMMLLTGASP